MFYLRSNQAKLRNYYMQGLIDHVQNSDLNNADKFKVGKAIILPSSYQGSPRAMQELYHDAMAISRNIGRPDLFITMTCNPNWPEIKRYLKDFPPGTSVGYIPTFVCRLFYLKCLALISELELVFGA